MKNLFRCFILCILLATPLIALRGQSSCDAKTNFEIKEVLNSISGKGIISSRKVYILLEEKDFSAQNLEKLFRFLASKYSTPNLLIIKAFTDSERLNKMIDYDNQGISVDFTNDEKGQLAQKLYEEERYPKSKGFTAEYYRDSFSEFFLYNLRKDESQVVRITIKE